MMCRIIVSLSSFPSTTALHTHVCVLFLPKVSCVDLKKLYFWVTQGTNEKSTEHWRKKTETINLIFRLYVFVDWLSFLCFSSHYLLPVSSCYHGKRSHNNRSPWFSLSARSGSYVTAVYKAVVCKLSFHSVFNFHIKKWCRHIVANGYCESESFCPAKHVNVWGQIQNCVLFREILQFCF